MDDKKTSLIIVLFLLILVLFFLCYYNIDHDLKTACVGLIFGVIGALTGLTVNVKGSIEQFVQSQTPSKSEPDNPNLSTKIQEIEGRLASAEIWQSKVHSLIVKKDALDREKPTKLGRQIGEGLKAGESINPK